MPKGGKQEKHGGKGHEKGPKGGPHGHEDMPGKRLGFEKRAQRAGEKGVAETKSAAEELAEKLPED